MTDRKRFSKRRESALWAVVDKEITNLRLDILRGKLEVISRNKQEEIVFNAIGRLADAVSAEYRKSYSTAEKVASQGSPHDQP